MITIAVDAMSGDRGHESVVAAVRDRLARDQDLRIIAVGRKDVLAPALDGVQRVEVLDTPDVITMDDKPLESLRRRKSSMFQAIARVKEGEADAALSCGNTGALMGMARIQLKMLEGYSRPAIGGFVPCLSCTDVFCMLDLGANVDRDAQMLVSFAYLGDALARAVRGIERPSVGLLNIGEEQLKGGSELQEAARLLQESPLNFIGNVEANSLYGKPADVVVCDGFSGNVFLKTMEGLSGMVRDMLLGAYTANPYAKLAGALSHPVLSGLKRTMDARLYNGAAFLGVRGLVVKSHGNADEVAFGAALDFTAKQARNDLIGMLRSNAA